MPSFTKLTILYPNTYMQLNLTQIVLAFKQRKPRPAVSFGLRYFAVSFSCGEHDNHDG